MKRFNRNARGKNVKKRYSSKYNEKPKGARFNSDRSNADKLNASKSNGGKPYKVKSNANRFNSGKSNSRKDKNVKTSKNFKSPKIPKRSKNFKNPKINQNLKNIDNNKIFNVKDYNSNNSNNLDIRAIRSIRDLNIRETKDKVKASVGFDNLIIQAISLLDESKKVSNVLVKRLREWYELYNPEFSMNVNDHQVFVRLICEGKDDKVKGSMGADLSKNDVDNIFSLAKKCNEIYNFMEQEDKYLKRIMKDNCPNINAVAGHLVGAKLIALAGSLKQLVLFPSSTVQILGAEKAFFRHIKSNAKMPKHGVIIQHPLVASSSKGEAGKRARALADKVLLAAKVDYFKGEFIGDKLIKELEGRFK